MFEEQNLIKNIFLIYIHIYNIKKKYFKNKTHLLQKKLKNTFYFDIICVKNSSSRLQFVGIFDDKFPEGTQKI